MKKDNNEKFAVIHEVGGFDGLARILDDEENDKAKLIYESSEENEDEESK